MAQLHSHARRLGALGMAGTIRLSLLHSSTANPHFGFHHDMEAVPNSGTYGILGCANVTNIFRDSVAYEIIVDRPTACMCQYVPV